MLLNATSLIKTTMYIGKQGVHFRRKNA